MNEQIAKDAIKRSSEAKHVLEHHAVVGAMNAIRADCYDKIESSRADQTNEREKLYMMLKACANFEAQFSYHVEHGKMAVSWLENYRAKAAVVKNRRG